MPFIRHKEKMFCFNCGTKLRDTDMFCYQCGAKVAEVKEEVACSQPASSFQQAVPSAAPIRILSNKCEACGGVLKEVAPGKYLCEYCGSEFITINGNQVTESKLTEKEILDVIYEAAEFEVKQMFREELNCFLRVIDKAPDNTVLLVKLGRAYRRNNMHAKAIECYEKSISLNPTYANAYSNLGTVYILATDYQKAEQYCRQGIALMEQNRALYTNDDYAVALSNCAIAVGKLGRKEEAKALLQKAEANGYKNGDAARKMIGIKKGFFG